MEGGTTVAGGRGTRLVLYITAILAGLCLLAAAGSLAAAVYIGQETDRAQCENAADARNTLRIVLEYVRDSSSRDRTPQQQASAREFWDGVLALAPPIDCSESGDPREEGRE